ncbi:HutD/Ves family protein [Labrys neptuniae]
MAIEHLTKAAYHTLPWKNGLGETDEIYLFPPGSSRDAFELRISSAPILEDGEFSSFPGVERIITLIQGAALELDFGANCERLIPLVPFRFDSALAPIGRPLAGVARVLNVMAARNRWRYAGSYVLAGPVEAPVRDGDLTVIFVIDGSWRLMRADEPQRMLDCRDTILARYETGLSLVADGAQARVLLVQFAACGN